MSSINKMVKNVVSNPLLVINWLNNKGLFRIFSDKALISFAYRIKFGKKLDLDNPQTYSEKLQWIKLYDRNPLYTKLVDKYEAKIEVAKLIGEEHIIPTIGVWDHFDDIPFDTLPNKFIMKATHNSGTYIICNNKNDFDKKKAKKTLEKALKKNYYYSGREWPYKDVKPRIICEELLESDDGMSLKDYKFFVFNGKMKAMFIATNRNTETETCCDFFDRDFNHLPFTIGHPNAVCDIKKPENFEEMIALAEKLGKDLPQARIDLYSSNGRIYFGEVTFFHWSGFKRFEPEEWDYTFGSWIKLPEYNKK